MTKQKTETTRKRRWFRRSLILLFILSILALFFSHGLRYLAVRWLEKQGADSARITWLHLNPLTGFLTVEGLLIHHDGEVVMYDQDIDINISLIDLIHRRLTVERASFVGVGIDIRQLEDGRFQVGGLILDGGVDEQEGKGKEKNGGDPWVLKVENLLLDRCAVYYVSPAGSVSLKAVEMEIRKLATDDSYGEKTSIFLAGGLNQAPLRLEIEELQISPQPLLDGMIRVKDLDISGFSGFIGEKLEVLKGRFFADGKFFFALTAENKMDFSYAGGFGFRGSRLKTPDRFVISVDELGWQGNLEYGGQDASRLDLAGSLQGSGLNVDSGGGGPEIEQETVNVRTDGSLQTGSGTQRYSGNSSIDLSGTLLSLEEGKSLKAAELSWEGRHDYQKGSSLRLTLDGALKGADMGVELADSGTKLGFATLDLGTKTTVNKEDKDFRVISNQLLRFSGSSLEFTEGERFRIADFSWQGEAEYSGAERNDLSVKGDMRASTSSMEMSRPELNLDLDSWTLTADTSLSTGEPDLKLTGEGDLEINGTALHLGREELLAGKINRIRLKKYRIHSLSDVGSDDLLITGLSLDFEGSSGNLTRDEPVLNVAEGRMQQISWSRASGLGVNDIALDGLTVHLIRNKGGDLHTGRVLDSLEMGVEIPDEQPDEKTPMKIRVNRARVSGKSRLTFIDHTLSEPFQVALDIKKLGMEDLDSTKPGRPTSVALEAKPDTHSVLDANGTVSPFADNVTLTLNTRLQNYPASNLSPYAVDLLGYYFSRGQVNLDSDLQLTGNNLDSENHFLFKKLEVKVADEEAAKELTGLLHDISLGQALSLLRDSDGHIALNLPVGGPLDELQVGFDHIVKKVVSSAVIKGTKSYLLSILGPYGALASVGLKAGGHLFKVRLSPVIFDPGRASLDTGQEEYLQKLAEILYERPELEVTAIGVTVPSEIKYITVESDKTEKSERQNEGTGQDAAQDRPLGDDERNRLLELATERAAAVRSYMIEKYDINPGRIFVGESFFDEDAAAEPRVEIGF